jgi:hypothetical protein
MVIGRSLVERLKPIAPEILSEDAKAVARVAERKGFYAGLDKHPAAMAMAGDRRAVVATAMRATIAPRHGWVLIEDHFHSGAYEWIVGDLIVRLSKTTPESREENAKALLGIQDPLFKTAPHPKAPREEVLIRLNVNPLAGPTTVDVVPVGPRGETGTAIPLKAIAAASTERIPTKTPAKPGVTLSGVRRRAADSK